MGWKASCILASTREDGYLGTFPTHDPRRADEIIKRLGLGKFERAGSSSFENGIYPQDDGLFVGAYDGAIILGTEHVATECLSESVPTFVQGLASCLPRAKMLALVLHSVVNLFGYAYYENGKLERVRAGTADDGLIIDWGKQLPEECPLFEKSIIKDGCRIFLAQINGETEEFSEDAFGEEFVFELSRKFLGKRLDCFDPWDLKMEKFGLSKRRSFWSWFQKG